MTEDLESISSYKSIIESKQLANPYFIHALGSLERERQNTSLAKKNCYPIKVSDDKYRVLVATNPDGYLYRGDNNEWFMNLSEEEKVLHNRDIKSNLIPGLKRFKNKEMTAAQWARTNMFIEWLKQSSYYSYLSQVKFGNLYFDPDLEAIAQHYGFCTNYLDFTTDINVAGFFAYTKLVNGKYEPLTDFKVHPKLYRIKMCDLAKNNPNSFKIVGFQCAGRAIAQQAFAIDFSKEINLEGMEEIILEDNPEKAIEIYNYYHQGNDLFSNDLLTNITNHVFKNKKEISIGSIIKYAQKEKISAPVLIRKLSKEYKIIEETKRPTEQDNAIIDLDICEWVNWLKAKTSKLEIYHLGESENGELKGGLEFLAGQTSETKGQAIIIQKIEK